MKLKIKKAGAVALFAGAVKSCGEKPLKTAVIAAAVLDIIVEILSRRSAAEAFESFAERPAFLLLNIFIIFLTFLPSLFAARRVFAQLLTEALWLGTGIASFVLRAYRTTPLAASDITTMPSVVSIMPKYLNPFQMAAVVLAAAAVAAGLVLAFRRLPKNSRNTKKAFIVTAACLTAVLVFLVCGFRLKLMRNLEPDLPDAYDKYGFASCFVLSIFNRGIDKPEDYSDKLLDEIIGELDSVERLEPADSTAAPVNIVFVQLESFFDVDHLKNIDFSVSPTRYFNTLKDSCMSGYLTVPVVGGGTVNTEFEVLTGMSLDYFGTGEIPYDTVLGYKTCESMAYNLREYGYKSHAIHNNNAEFYNRDKVYANLGFDTFTSLEYMTAVEYNELGWAKDSVLTGEIIKAMSAQEGPDFVYAVSVQSHGRYPEELFEGESYAITSEGAEEDKSAALDYYANEIRETDAFIGELVSALSQYDEPVLAVFFGDHLPGLNIEPDMLTNGSVYDTEYVIWTNFRLVGYDKDLSAYQLSAYVMELLNYDSGVLTKLHRSREGQTEEEYQQKLEAVEYDMLYGDMMVFDGKTVYEPSKLKMGVCDITVTGAERRGEAVFIYGENFTRWSEVLIDGEAMETYYIDSGTLLLTDAIPEDGTKISVAQISDKGTILSRTENHLLTEFFGSE